MIFLDIVQLQLSWRHWQFCTNVAVVRVPDVRSATAASIEVINRETGICAFLFPFKFELFEQY